MKRLFYLVILLLIVIVEVCLYSYLRFNDGNEIYIRFNDIKEIEYGSLIDIKEFVKDYHGEIEYPKLDSFDVGMKSLSFKVSDNHNCKEYIYHLFVKDTQKPIIVLKDDFIEIEEGEVIDFKNYVSRVYDVVDGDLMYSKKGSGYFIEDVDYSQFGEYKVNVVARDRFGNCSEKIINVVVKKKVDEDVDDNEQDLNVNNDRKVIVINPGHQSKGNNGKELIGPQGNIYKTKVSYGSTGIFTGISESQTVLSIGLKLKEELKHRGYIVYMTRMVNDVDISNKNRALFANEMKADVFISLHCDSIDNKSVKGAHTICIDKDNIYCNDLYDESKKLAYCIIDEYCKNTLIANRGISYRNDLTTLNWSNVPAIMIEMGFNSNKEEDILLNDDDFQYKIVDGICNGIDLYFVD